MAIVDDDVQPTARPALEIITAAIASELRFRQAGRQHHDRGTDHWSTLPEHERQAWLQAMNLGLSLFRAAAMVAPWGVEEKLMVTAWLGRLRDHPLVAPPSEYPMAFLRELASSWYNNFADNHDVQTLGAEPPPPISGEYLYGLLADQPSRDLLVKLMAYRVLGHRKVRLPRNTPVYWHDIQAMDDLKTGATPLPISFNNVELPAFDLRPLGYDLTLNSSAVGLARTFVQKQYEYHRGDVHCKVEPTDVVLDAGACWGETSLYFAHEAGPLGAVLAYEFVPNNLEVFRRNLALNPAVKDRIRLAENALWDISGQHLHFVDWGPGSRLTEDASKYPSTAGLAATTTVDESVQLYGMQRVNFIKMDIGGAELAALRGGEATIRRFRPKLAISLYHKPEDIETIPQYLAGLDLGYRFYLDHHTIYGNDTVLFAVP